MKVQVVSDARGHIISLSVPGDVRGISGIARAGVMPAAGQQVHTLDVPTELESRPLLELHQSLRVEGAGHTAKLVRADRFTEPFLKEP
jgi:hypothetical protein